MGKTMCKMDKKDRQKKKGKAKYKCKNCGAEAAKEKHLCKPKKI